MNIIITLSTILFISPIFQDGLSTYTNTRYNCSIEYPSKFIIKTYGDDSFSFVEGKDFVVDGDILNVAEWKRADMLGVDQSFDETKVCDDYICIITLDRAIAYSQADGPDGSSYCTDPEIIYDYKTKSGQRVIKFYMIQIDVNYSEDTITKYKVGPYYGINFWSKGNEYILLIQYKHQTLADAEDELMLTKIVDSFK